MSNEIEQLVNKINENIYIIKQLEKEKRKILEEALKSEEIFKIFKKQEIDKLIRSLETKAIIRLNDGHMPKKAMVEQFRQSDKFEGMLKQLKEESLKLKSLEEATSFNKVSYVSKSDIKKFIYRNLQDKNDIENYKHIVEQTNKLTNHNRKIISSYIENYDFEKLIVNSYNDMFKLAKLKIENYFKTNTIYFEDDFYDDYDDDYDYYDYYYSNQIELSEKNIQQYFDWLYEFDNLDIALCNIITAGDDFFEPFIITYIENHLPEDLKIFLSKKYAYYEDDILKETLVEAVCSLTIEHDLTLDLRNTFTNKYVLELLKENKKYSKSIKYMNYVINEMEDLILTEIPDNYIDLYPLARTIKRHFTLHIGPTNSGKTYAALTKLKEAENGIYLAPLRLLAFEKYEELNNDGFLCSLKTGEEQIIKENANYISSTIEMANFSIKYDCAVVDECQMLTDDVRGCRWTSVILGLACPTIHLCLSNNAKDIIIKLIDACGDTYEIIEYNRKNELKCDTENFNSYKDVKKGDALIVFSKKSVYAVAAELQALNIKSSIIYGALPYDVKQSEAKKFSDGETDVIIATDAIGMGLNLPIKRVVFLENTKFDGKIKRSLYSYEIKQIAGRAGRYGINEYGLYNIYGSKKERYQLEQDVNCKEYQISYARLAFPESLVSIKGNLSDILSKWLDIHIDDFYDKQDLDKQINLTKQLEKISNNKKLIFKFITMGFDDKYSELCKLWQDIFKVANCNRKYNIPVWLNKAIENIEEKDLDFLEYMFKTCDLLYQYYDKFNYLNEVNIIMSMRQKISKQMIIILKNCSYSDAIFS